MGEYFKVLNEIIDAKSEEEIQNILRKIDKE